MDALIEPAGSFGRFQKLNLFIIGCITSLAAVYYSLVILNYLEPNIKCKLSSLHIPNRTEYIAQLNREPICNLWHNYTIHFFDTSPRDKRLYWCYLNDTFGYGSNVITEWNLVCKHKYLGSISQSLFLFGTLCAFLSEKAGSRFGRKKASFAFICLLILFQIITLVLLSDIKFANFKAEYRYLIYSISQFFIGILVYCMSNSTYLILIDLTTASYQQAISKINVYFFLAGEMASVGLVYMVQNWRIVNIILTCITIFLLLLFVILVPDSPRWCIESGRFDEAYDIMKKMARFNKKKAYDTLKYKEYALKRFKSDSIDVKLVDYIDRFEDDLEPDEIKLESVVIFRNKIFFPFSKCLKFFIIVCFFNCLSINFFGISLGVISFIPVNAYIMLLLSTVSGIVGTLLCNLNEKIGYKKALLIYLFSMGLSLLVLASISFDSPLNLEKWFILIKGGIYLFSKTMIIAAYNTAIVICAELFDIKLRLNVMLILNCIGCISTLVAPQVNLLKYFVWKPLPFLIYAFSSFLSFLIAYHLPVARRLKKKKKFDITF